MRKKQKRRKIRQYRYRRNRKLRMPGIKRKLAFLLFGLMVFGAGMWGVGFLVYQGLGRSDFFQITAINIKGCQRTTKSMVLEMSGVDIHSNLMALNVAKVKDRLEEDDWVERVDIERDWPDRLTITVWERTPVALVNRHDGLYYLDRRGVKFAKVRGKDDMDFPLITGLKQEVAPESIKGSRLGDALLFIRYASRGSSILPAQNISEINIGQKDEMVLFLANRPFPIKLGRGNIGRKYYRLSKVLYHLYKKKEFPHTAYIDVDYKSYQVLVGKVSKS